MTLFYACIFPIKSLMFIKTVNRNGKLGFTDAAIKAGELDSLNTQMSEDSSGEILWTSVMDLCIWQWDCEANSLKALNHSSILFWLL